MGRLLVLVIASIIISCNSSNTQQELAKEGIYYFKITDMCNGTDLNLQNELVEKLSKKKYAITHTAGKQWPFFQEFEIADSIFKQDLMAPHIIYHTFKSFKNQNNLKDQDAKLDITLHCNNGEFSFDMTIYHLKNNQWLRTVDTGNHVIPRNRYKTEEELAQVFYQTIVRYSFK